jgi:hypothetical protein
MIVRKSIPQETIKGGKGTMADVDTLIKDLSQGDYYSRASAARALGEAGGEKAAEALIGALNDEDDWVKEYAAEALGKLAYTKAVESLGKLLEDDNYKIRSSVVTALGKIGGDKAHGLLEPLREDSDSWVREAVANALKAIDEAPDVAEPEKPVAMPEPIPAKIEPDPELSLSEAPVDPATLATAEKHALADHVPLTPEEIVQLVVEGTSAKYKATRSGFLLRILLRGGRQQKVRLKFNSVDEDGSPIIQIFSVIGPAREEYYRWALKLNPTFSYGAIGLVKIDDKDMLVAMDTFLEETVDIKALKKSVWTLAGKADGLEQKLIKKDLW